MCSDILFSFSPASPPHASRARAMPSERSRRPARCLPHLSSAFAVWWRRRAPRRGVSKRRSATADRYSGVRELSSVPELRGPIDARLFFERFVATRTPVIVRGGVQRETMAVLADDAALDAAAGDCQLQVEALTHRPRPDLPPTPSLRLGQPAHCSLLTAVPYSLTVAPLTHYGSTHDGSSHCAHCGSMHYGPTAGRGPDRPPTS